MNDLPAAKKSLSTPVTDIVLDGAVSWLARFLSADDFRDLDRFIAARSMETGAPRSDYTAECRFFGRAIDSGYVSFSCAREGAGGFAASGETWPVRATGQPEGITHSMKLADIPELRLLKMTLAARAEPTNSALEFELTIREDRMLGARQQRQQSR